MRGALGKECVANMCTSVAKHVKRNGQAKSRNSANEFLATKGNQSRRQCGFGSPTYLKPVQTPRPGDRLIFSTPNRVKTAPASPGLFLDRPKKNAPSQRDDAFLILLTIRNSGPGERYSHSQLERPIDWYPSRTSCNNRRHIHHRRTIGTTDPHDRRRIHRHPS